eukprot:TRINITY_DN25566_c0_g1_i2.p2 TRINITY_DN25566_c0_g1~~TRINITY_DN25566_c0_g1_i2.p2  ORF type:complete len:116 (+),score=0.74 TRINITY_DN25566_c0_g1_i2:76-423(+)
MASFRTRFLPFLAVIMLVSVVAQGTRPSLFDSEDERQIVPNEPRTGMFWKKAQDIPAEVGFGKPSVPFYQAESSEGSEAGDGKSMEEVMDYSPGTYNHDHDKGHHPHPATIKSPT